MKKKCLSVDDYGNQMVQCTLWSLSSLTWASFQQQISITLL